MSGGGEVRCPYCRRLNARSLRGTIVIECKRCGKVFRAEATMEGSSATSQPFDKAAMRLV